MACPWTALEEQLAVTVILNVVVFFFGSIRSSDLLACKKELKVPFVPSCSCAACKSAIHVPQLRRFNT